MSWLTPQYGFFFAGINFMVAAILYYSGLNGIGSLCAGMFFAGMGFRSWLGR